MKTCVNCGADAVDASGVCQACGRRAEDTSAPRHASHDNHTSFDSFDNADSVAATREADIPLPARRVTAAPPLARQGGPATPAPRGGSGVYGGGSPSTKRFCGSCGAEIEPGMQFCGQCGTPVAAGFDEQAGRATLAGGPPRGTYPGYDDWSPADQDAPTEQFTPPFGFPNTARRSGGAFSPYTSGATQTEGGLSREMRAFLGILCLLGALISGAGAIILAFVH